MILLASNRNEMENGFQAVFLGLAGVKIVVGIV